MAEEVKAWKAATGELCLTQNEAIEREVRSELIECLRDSRIPRPYRTAQDDINAYAVVSNLISNYERAIRALNKLHILDPEEPSDVS